MAHHEHAVRRRTAMTEVCAYGEVVGIRLFCAYPIDVLGRPGDSPALASILTAHSSVIPRGDAGGAGIGVRAQRLAAGLLARAHARGREILDRARYHQDFRPETA